MFISYKCSSQNCISITGLIADSLSSPLNSVIVSANTLNKTVYAISSADGKFKLLFCYDTIIPKILKISCKILDFVQLDTLLKINKSEINLGEIKLYAKNIFLDEVIVKAKPIIQKGDTTIFNVGSFKNKLDNNLEDVLKKMPGFDIDPSGVILFNGKQIENILIEGDELTKNYKQVSKNITPDMIDKVEIVDKYNSNPALKNLVNGTSQIMNLKLKNSRKLKTFGTVKAGLGIENKLNFSGNQFLLNSKIKNLSIVNKNNLGESPYNEIGYDLQNNQPKDYDFDNSIIPNLISEDRLFNKSTFSLNSNTLFNKSNMLVINNSINLNKHLTLKVFSDIYSDKINQFRQTQVKNINNNNLSFNENIQKKFNPLFFNNLLQLTYQNNKNQMILLGAFNQKKYKQMDMIDSPIDYETKINNDYKRFSGGLFYTHRIDSNKAIQLLIQNNYDSRDDNLIINQNSYRDLDTFSTNSQNQIVGQNVNYTKGTLKYLFKKNNKKVNTLSLTNTNIVSDLNSSLGIYSINSQFVFPDNFNNKAKFYHNNLALGFNKNFSIKKLNFSINTDVSYFNQKSLNNNYNFNTKALNLLPSFTFAYNFNSKNFISFNVGYDNVLPSLGMLSQNPILNNYRSIISNQAVEPRISNFRYNLIYSYRDFDKATNFVFTYFHNTQSRSLLSNISFSKDFDYINTNYQNANQVLDNLYTKFDKYIYSIKTGLSIKNNLILFSVPILSNSLLASRKNLRYISTLLIRPNFKKNINTQIGIETTIDKDLNSKTSAYTINPFMSSTILLTKKISVGTKLNFYKSNFFVEKQNYFFGNLIAFYSLKKDKIDLKFSLINFTNTTTVLSGYKNVFIEKSISDRNLSRFALLEVNYKF